MCVCVCALFGLGCDTVKDRFATQAESTAAREIEQRCAQNESTSDHALIVIESDTIA